MTAVAVAAERRRTAAMPAAAATARREGEGERRGRRARQGRAATRVSRPMWGALGLGGAWGMAPCWLVVRQLTWQQSCVRIPSGGKPTAPTLPASAPRPCLLCLAGMEVTFLPGLENLGARLLEKRRSAEARQGETVWDAYMRRKR